MVHGAIVEDVDEILQNIEPAIFNLAAYALRLRSA
jgi:hypothetical protein